MTWFGWVLIVVSILDVLGRVAAADRPRPARSKSLIALDVSLNTALIFGIHVVGTGHL